MSANDKIIIFLVFMGMLISFAGILAIVIDKYRKKENEKKEDELADIEEMNQKILQIHDYGQFLSKELENKQNEAMLMYEMLLDKEKQLQHQNMEEKNPFAFMADQMQAQETLAAKPETKPKLISKVAETSRQRNVPKQEAEAVNDNAQIIKLYNQGLSEEEIARQLEIGKGQVELVVRLFAK
ncbi:hypothetical protein EII17_05535 [Clostridiales bacterium COT073_COT-073]|nr:hypothetical protein EII17_05535 [Clostridiales bacterium COT073_COT-073]